MAFNGYGMLWWTIQSWCLDFMRVSLRPTAQSPRVQYSLTDCAVQGVCSSGVFACFASAALHQDAKSKATKPQAIMDSHILSTCNCIESTTTKALVQ